LTSDRRNTVAAFVKRYSIPWPSGYGVGRQVLANFGTARAGPDEVPLGFGEPQPTIYVIRADGTVHWNDGRSRYQHHSTADLVQELERQIEKALATGQPERPR
jgi:hypothetical protein